MYECEVPPAADEEFLDVQDGDKISANCHDDEVADTIVLIGRNSATLVCDRYEETDCNDGLLVREKYDGFLGKTQ